MYIFNLQFIIKSDIIGKIKLIISDKPKLWEHPRYTALKKCLNNIINYKINRTSHKFL